MVIVILIIGVKNCKPLAPRQTRPYNKECTKHYLNYCNVQLELHIPMHKDHAQLFPHKSKQISFSLIFQQSGLTEIVCQPLRAFKLILLSSHILGGVSFPLHF